MSRLRFHSTLCRESDEIPVNIIATVTRYAEAIGCPEAHAYRCPGWDVDILSVKTDAGALIEPTKAEYQRLSEEALEGVLA